MSTFRVLITNESDSELGMNGGQSLPDTVLHSHTKTTFGSTKGGAPSVSVITDAYQMMLPGELMSTNSGLLESGTITTRATPCWVVCVTVATLFALIGSDVLVLTVA